jgi:hypothetical protein
VLVTVLSFSVKLYKWVRDRRLENEAEHEKAELGEVDIASSVKEEMPFGLRALLNDPEVEGVWNPRTLDEINKHPPTSATHPTSVHKKARYRSRASSHTYYDSIDAGLASPNGKG